MLSGVRNGMASILRAARPRLWRRVLVGFHRMNPLRSALYFVAGFLLMVNVGLANATIYRVTGFTNPTTSSMVTNACIPSNSHMIGRQWDIPTGTAMATVLQYMTSGGTWTRTTDNVTFTVTGWEAYSSSELRCKWTGSNGSNSSGIVGVQLSSTPQSCPEGQVRNATTGQCETPAPVCTAGETTDFGVFPVPSGGGTACYGSCAVTHSSTPEGEGYRWTGTVTGQCSPVEQPETCTETSANFLGYVNDKPFCADQGENPTPDPDPDPDPDPEEPGGGSGSEGDCPEGQTWVPGTSGGAGSCVNGSGDGGGGDTGGGTGGTGGGDGTGDGTGTGGGDTGGGSGDGSGTGGGSGDGEGEGECTGEDCEEGGTPAEIGDIYDKKDKTFGDVLGGFQQKVSEAPFVAAASGFFTVNASGSCPIWSRTVPLLGTITIDHFCSSTALYWLGIAGYAILALASFTAFRWAFL